MSWGGYSSLANTKIRAFRHAVVRFLHYLLADVSLLSLRDTGRIIESTRYRGIYMPALNGRENAVFATKNNEM